MSGTGQGAGRRGLGGALHFENTLDVVVERVRAITRSQTDAETAAVTARNVRSARVSSCEIWVGDLQHGLLFVDVDRVVAEDNRVGVAPNAQRVRWDMRMTDRQALARMKKEMIADARLGRARAGGPNREELRLGVFAVNFATSSALRLQWARLLAAVPPPGGRVASDRDLLRYVETLAERLLRGEGLIGGFREFRGWFQNLVRNERAAGARGISVTGRVAPEVRVVRNQISGFSSGVHVGLSDHRPHQHARRVAGRVWIEDNAIDIWLNGDSVRARFGIFAGNCDFLRICANDIAYGRSSGVPSSRVTEGVRVYGQLGRLVVVRENRIAGSSTGIRFVPTNLPARAQWLVTDNLCPTNPPARFGDPARGIGESAVATRVRGEEFNVGP